MYEFLSVCDVCELLLGIKCCLRSVKWLYIYDLVSFEMNCKGINMAILRGSRSRMWILNLKIGCLYVYANIFGIWRKRSKHGVWYRKISISISHGMIIVDFRMMCRRMGWLEFVYGKLRIYLIIFELLKLWFCHCFGRLIVRD